MPVNHRTEMKAENQRYILNLINKQPISRTAIAAESGLTLAAVSLLTDELISDGILHVIGADQDSAVGRKPELLDIRADWGFVIGISCDRDGVTIGLTDLKGTVLSLLPTFPLTADYQSTIEQAAQGAEQIIAQNPQITASLLGVGVTVPGPMDAVHGNILEPPGFPESWYHLPLQELLEQRLSLPVYIEHNSRAFAQAEICFGSGGKHAHFMVLTVNAGIGSGLVLDGKVYTGAHGVGCEAGHVSIERDGRLCFCGKRGCFEQYASTSALLHEVQRLKPEIASWHDFMDHVYHGDSVCTRFLELEASYFGQLIGNILSFCDLEAVFFTGQISYRGEILIERIKKAVKNETAAFLSGFPDLALSSVTGNPYLVSSAAVVIYRIYYQPLFYYEKISARKEEKQNETDFSH